MKNLGEYSIGGPSEKTYLRMKSSKLGGIGEAVENGLIVSIKYILV